MEFETDLEDNLTTGSGASFEKYLNRIGGLAISLYFGGSNLGISFCGCMRYILSRIAIYLHITYLDLLSPAETRRSAAITCRSDP